MKEVCIPDHRRGYRGESSRLRGLSPDLQGVKKPRGTKASTGGLVNDVSG